MADERPLPGHRPDWARSRSSDIARHLPGDPGAARDRTGEPVSVRGTTCRLAHLCERREPRRGRRRPGVRVSKLLRSTPVLSRFGPLDFGLQGPASLHKDLATLDILCDRSLFTGVCSARQYALGVLIER